MVQQEGLLIRGVDEHQLVRVVGVDVTSAAERVRRAHGLWADAAALAAEGCAATALLAVHIKGEERLSLQVQGERPRVAFTGDIDAEGRIRARLTPASVSRTKGRLSGLLMAMKSDGRKELYRGMTEIADTTLEEALASHLTRSSQVDSILRLHVEQASDGRVLWAGGFYVERLPEHEVHGFVTAEQFHARFGGLVERDPAEVVIELRAGLLGTGRFRVLEERDVVWQCRCGQEKVEGMLHGLDLDTLRAMLEEDKGAEVQCHFCNHTYVVTELRLAQILAEVQGN
jgi:molecular chaperone Hsp33